MKSSSKWSFIKMLEQRLFVTIDPLLAGSSYSIFTRMNLSSKKNYDWKSDVVYV